MIAKIITCRRDAKQGAESFLATLLACAIALLPVGAYADTCPSLDKVSSGDWDGFREVFKRPDSGRVLGWRLAELSFGSNPPRPAIGGIAAGQHLRCFYAVNSADHRLLVLEATTRNLVVKIKGRTSWKWQCSGSNVISCTRAVQCWAPKVRVLAGAPMSTPHIKDSQIEQILARHAAIAEELSGTLPRERFVQLSKEYAELSPVAESALALKKARKEFAELEEMTADKTADKEMRALADAELQDLWEKLPQLELDLQLMLLPKDAADERGVVLEVRAGTGGDEAGLFAADLFRMYSRYAETKRWKVEILSASEGAVGGYKEVIAEISGKGVFARLKYRSRHAPRAARARDRSAEGAFTPRRRRLRFFRRRRKSISRSMRRISRSMSIARPARAGSMSTRPIAPSGSRICRRVLSSNVRTSVRSTRTKPTR